MAGKIKLIKQTKKERKHLHLDCVYIGNKCKMPRARSHSQARRLSRPLPEIRRQLKHVKRLLMPSPAWDPAKPTLREIMIIILTFNANDIRGMNLHT